MSMRLASGFSHPPILCSQCATPSYQSSTMHLLPKDILDIVHTPIEESSKENEENRINNLDNICELRRDAAAVSHSFRIKDFQPAWFAKNEHLQTIIGVVARQKYMYFPNQRSSEIDSSSKTIDNFQWDQRQTIETPDGDFFHVDWKFVKKVEQDNIEVGTYRPEDDMSSNSATTPLVLICHGLQSNSDSPLAKDMAIAFNNVGMDAACINTRGCSGVVSRNPMGYHLSYTEDLKLMVEYLAKAYPGTRIYLSGFSLGANVITRYLADEGIDAVVKYNIKGAAVNAVPFNLTKTRSVNYGLEKFLYGDRLLDSLKERILRSMDEAGVKYEFTRDSLMECKTCMEFDDLVISSVYDFDGVDDYHRKSSNSQRLTQIMVPQLAILAMDDPFFTGDDIPQLDHDSPLKIQYTQHGGHCGYVFHSANEDTPESSFVPTQMARFLKHVQNNIREENIY
eukprot:CAMPEP_0194076452 /NCGR_PEP_ID=MMETSP0149-20130528/3251_1 /TAXON_ID=122233 /ORGANISM="Chaetoceros debilis, Strain MM31A-1" /LENGTH=452 /DNA_ID=CAMNT_0038757201 /DNA_START=117 /DNA_END=1475 /DNA_ORIENTATION=+